MKERISSATEAFKSASGSETHLFIFFILLCSILMLVIGGVYILTHRERRAKFKRFFSKLQKADISQHEGKKLFNHIGKKYHGYHFLFFKEERVAQKAIKTTGVKGNFGIFFPSLHCEETKEKKQKELDPVLKNRKKD